MDPAVSVRKLREMKELMLNPPQVEDDFPVYYVFRGVVGNITILLPGNFGGEYAKTFGHYHKHGEEEVYRVLYGNGLLLLQKLGEQLDVVSDFKIIPLSEGQEITVPAGFGHALVNTSSDLLVTLDKEPASAGHIYEPVKKMKGFAYYIVDDGLGGWKKVFNNTYAGKNSRFDK